MKCDENGGCPLRVIIDTSAFQSPGRWCAPTGKLCEHAQLSCHLTPADFPLINAMIAGKWSCEKCNSFEHCLEEQGGMPWACKFWKPKGGE